MKYGTVIRLLTVACVSIVQLAGCLPDTEDMKKSVPGIPIRIVAEMNKGTDASRMTKVPVRSEGGWKENYIGAEEYEKTVKHVLLFAYKDIGTSPEKVIFYHPQGTANPLAGITGIDHFEMREMGGINAGNSDIALDLELMGGNYNFILLVNCESGLKKIQEEHIIPDPKQLTEKTEIFTSDDLKGENRKYLPMTGQCNFLVPDNMGGNNRVTLSPSILLERMHARVEFILTTVDDEGNYLSPLLPLSIVTKLTLNNETSGYSVLPSAEEYTATGGGSPMIRGVDYAGEPLLLPDRPSFHEGANEGSGESAFVAKCKERLLPYTGETRNYIYVAPGGYRKGKDEALALVLSIDYRTGDPDETYKIELHNPDLKQDDKAYYNIRRNTIYRVFSTLKGTKNMEYDVVVDEWEDTKVAIPW
ncbi:hypothetical protein [Parabacteroides timonensis]|uniref:hypothetical protein n=1 Tax=Parabacteroides timonensis TaxID=1871013 RepID=UPI00094E0A35|nr:hypothetical protein [Parabacteroides timonensis]